MNVEYIETTVTSIIPYSIHEDMQLRWLAWWCWWQCYGVCGCWGREREHISFPHIPYFPHQQSLSPSDLLSAPCVSLSLGGNDECRKSSFEIEFSFISLSGWASLPLRNLQFIYSVHFDSSRELAFIKCYPLGNLIPTKQVYVCMCLAHEHKR